jgi:hypothetical protein
MRLNAPQLIEVPLNRYEFDVTKGRKLHSAPASTGLKFAQLEWQLRIQIR